MSGAEAQLPAGADVDSEEFWQALAAGDLRLPRCEACGRGFFPPLPRCPNCGSERVGLEPDDGAGSVYSWVRVHITLDSEFGGETPYTIVAVDLDHGGRAMGRLRGAEDGLAAGAPVALEAYKDSTGATVIGFRLSDREE